MLVKRGEQCSMDLPSSDEKTNIGIFSPCLYFSNHIIVCVSPLLH